MHFRHFMAFSKLIFYFFLIGVTVSLHGQQNVIFTSSETNFDNYPFYVKEVLDLRVDTTKEGKYSDGYGGVGRLYAKGGLSSYMKSEYGKEDKENRQVPICVVIRDFDINQYVRNTGTQYNAFFEVYLLKENNYVPLAELDFHSYDRKRTHRWRVATSLRILWNKCFTSYIEHDNSSSFTREELVSRYSSDSIKYIDRVKYGAYRTFLELKSQQPGIIEFEIEKQILDGGDTLLSFVFDDDPHLNKDLISELYAVSDGKNCYLNLLQLTGVEGWTPIKNYGRYWLVEGNLSNKGDWLGVAAVTGGVVGGLVGGAISILIMNSAKKIGSNKTSKRDIKKYGGMSVLNTENGHFANMSEEYTYLIGHRNKELLRMHDVKYYRKMKVEDRLQFIKTLNDLIRQE